MKSLRRVANAIGNTKGFDQSLVMGGMDDLSDLDDEKDELELMYEDTSEYD